MQPMKTLTLVLILLKSMFQPIAAEPTSALTLSNAELGALLQEYKLSGVSVAVVDNYQIIYSATEGEKVFGSGEKIDENTAFSTASISKPITALLVAMLEEQGKLSMDDSVARYLKRWKLSESDFPQPEKITFRRLLSHTAGTTQGGFVDYYEGDDVPSAIDSLNGVKVPRYNTPISLMFEPGTAWAYSGGGYVIVQVAIEDLTGKSLPQLAQEMLFAPLGLANTTMHQPNTQAFLSNVASVHNDDLTVIGSGLPICPQIAPSGMWSSAVDMAKLVIEMQKALAGKPTQVISSNVARKTTQIETLDAVGGWGLGWMRMEANGNLDWFSHGGANTGTGGHVMGTMEKGRGIAIFGNGGNPSRMPVIDTLTATIIERMGWAQPSYSQKEPAPDDVVASMLGTYQSVCGQSFEIKQENGKLIYQGNLKLWSADNTGTLIYTGNGQFQIDEYANLLSIDTSVTPKRIQVSRPGTDKVSYFESSLTQ